jgi:hypothetical protein
MILRTLQLTRLTRLALSGLALLAPIGAGAGNLTSAEALADVVYAADQGVPSAVAARDTLHAQATQSWRWGNVDGTFVTTLQGGNKACHPSGDPGRADALKEGAPDAYAKVLAYHLRTDPDDDRLLALASEARSRVLDWVDTEGFHGLTGLDWSGSNQCILELGISIPIWIETALLLEDTPVWSAADRSDFAGWLAGQVYPKVAWASRVRRNNWGAAGSLAASLIAHYVDGEVPTLVEVEPVSLVLDPPAAGDQHDAVQLARIRTSWPGDSDCPQFGIQDHGGIPDELRRGAGGCSASFIPSPSDSALAYQSMHVELLVYHAEALRRRGDPALFTARTVAGDPALLQAILFVIDNPSPGGRSWDWGTRSGTLRLASRVYADPRLDEALRHATSFRGGRTLPYATFAPPLAPQPLDGAQAAGQSLPGA